MTVKMTERDKKLLIGLGVFCVLALFVTLVFLPLYRANASMKEQIRQNEERVEQMKKKEAELPAVQKDNAELKKQLAVRQQDLYPMLKSQEIDKLLAQKTLRNGLSARKLQISMPEEPANVKEYGRTKDNGSNPDGEDGIWIAEVNLEVTGSMEEMDRLIDELALETPGVAVAGLTWSSDRRQADASTGRTEVFDILGLRLEVLMSDME